MALKAGSRGPLSETRVASWALGLLHGDSGTRMLLGGGLWSVYVGRKSGMHFSFGN